MMPPKDITKVLTHIDVQDGLQLMQNEPLKTHWKTRAQHRCKLQWRGTRPNLCNITMSIHYLSHVYMLIVAVSNVDIDLCRDTID